MYFPTYPAKPLQYGDSGAEVETMQAAMNVILAKYPTHDVLVEDGYFGEYGGAFSLHAKGGRLASLLCDR